MDVTAYPRGDAAAGPASPILLGNIAEQIWTGGWKFSQERSIQVSRPIGAAIPNLFDRITKTMSCSFAAGRSFPTLGEALLFFGTHPDQVPTLADLQFSQGGEHVWLRNCGIQRIELVEKRGALVIFSYPIIGGTWSPTKS